MFEVSDGMPDKVRLNSSADKALALALAEIAEVSEVLAHNHIVFIF